MPAWAGYPTNRREHRTKDRSNNAADQPEHSATCTAVPASSTKVRENGVGVIRIRHLRSHGSASEPQTKKTRSTRLAPLIRLLLFVSFLFACGVSCRARTKEV